MDKKKLAIFGAIIVALAAIVGWAARPSSELRDKLAA